MKKFICAAALAASAAAAQDKPAMPKPAEELKVERWFVGTWTCKGTRQPGPMGPGGPVATRLTVKMDLAGFWLQVRIDATEGPMKGEVGEGFATWDAAAKQHARYDFNLGPRMTKFTTPGWDGDKLVFDGEAMMGGPKLRHTITKKGKGEFQSVFEFAGPDGKMATVEEGSCTRAAKK